jgi:ribosomal protein S18 acetylase RimI-like enzyme
MTEDPGERIRAARRDEAEALAALVNSAYRGEGSRQGWTTEADLLDGTRVSVATVQALLADPECSLLVIGSERRLAGCVELRPSGAKLYVGMLTVAPDAQGRGLGGRLMDAAEARARDRGFAALVMTVISVRRELIAWYVRRGFRPTGETHPFAFADESFGLPKQPLEFAVLEKRLG